MNTTSSLHHAQWQSTAPNSCTIYTLNVYFYREFMDDTRQCCLFARVWNLTNNTTPNNTADFIVSSSMPVQHISPKFVMSLCWANFKTNDMSCYHVNLTPISFSYVSKIAYAFYLRFSVSVWDPMIRTPGGSNSTLLLNDKMIFLIPVNDKSISVSNTINYQRAVLS